LLPNALNYLAVLNVHSGAFDTAIVLIDEVDAITEATGLPPLKYAAAMLRAWRGDEAELQAFYDLFLDSMMQRGEGSAYGQQRWLLALAHNGLAQYGKALETARRGCEHEDVIAFGHSLAELIEAAVRAGQPDEATVALERLRERTQACATEWALGTEAR